MKRVRSTEFIKSTEYDYLRVLGNRDLVLKCLCPFLSFYDMSALFAVNRRIRSILQNDTTHPIHLIRREWEVDGFRDVYRIGSALLVPQNLQLAQFVFGLTEQNPRGRAQLMEECVSLGFIKGVDLFGNREEYRIKYGIQLGIKKGKGPLMCHLIKTEFKNITFRCSDYADYLKDAIIAGDVDTFLFLFEDFERASATCPEESCSSFVSELPYLLLSCGKNIEKFLPHIDLSRVHPDKQIADVLNNRNVEPIRFIFSKYDLTRYRSTIRAALRYCENLMRRMLTDVICDLSLGISDYCSLILAKTNYLARILSKEKRI